MFIIDKSGKAKKINGMLDLNGLEWDKKGCRVLDNHGKTLIKKINKTDFLKKFG